MLVLKTQESFKLLKLFKTEIYVLKIFIQLIKTQNQQYEIVCCDEVKEF